MRSKSSRVSSTPTLPAMASRCTTALVEPPTAARATIALWNEARVSRVLGRRSRATRSTARRPLRLASASNLLSGAGVPARPGTTIPRASATSAIVDAVPIVLQCPRLRIIADSDAVNSAEERVPARTSSLSRQTSVPQPRGRPRKVPVSMGPPGTTTAGRSTEAAAISRAGIVLSQPPSRTTPSTGLARSISSAAIAARFRHSIAVGRTWVSPIDITGRSRAIPPAWCTPSRTAPATSSRWELHGVRSEAVLAMARWGRPENASAGRPRRIQARWM